MLQVLLGFNVHSHNFVERFMKMNPGNDVRKFESMFWEKSTWQLNASSKSSRIPFWLKKDSKQEVQGNPVLTSRHISKKQQKRPYHYKLTSSPKWCNENMFFDSKSAWWVSKSIVFLFCVSFPIKQTFTPLTRKKTVKTLRWKLRYFNCWPYELVKHDFVQRVYVFICI